MQQNRAIAAAAGVTKADPAAGVKGAGKGLPANLEALPRTKQLEYAKRLQAALVLSRPPDHPKSLKAAGKAKPGKGKKKGG